MVATHYITIPPHGGEIEYSPSLALSSGSLVWLETLGRFESATDPIASVYIGSKSFKASNGDRWYQHSQPFAGVRQFECGVHRPKAKIDDQENEFSSPCKSQF